MIDNIYIDRVIEIINEKYRCHKIKPIISEDQFYLIRNETNYIGTIEFYKNFIKFCSYYRNYYVFFITLKDLIECLDTKSYDNNVN